MSPTYWSRHLEPFPEKDVEYYAKIVSKIREGRRTVFTAEGTEELTEEEYTKYLIKDWTGSSREYVWNMIDALTKK